jgi:hypothetical protein
MSWALIWLAVFVVAFGAFTLISLLIAARGVAEIRELFAALEEEKHRRKQT